MTGKAREPLSCNMFSRNRLSHWRRGRREFPAALGMLGPSLAYNIAKGKS